MLTRIKNLWLYLRYFLWAKKIWRRPNQSKVLIFDSCNQDILMEFLDPWNPEVLHLRGEQINMRVLFASLFIGGSKTDAYIDCFIEKVQPHLVVTFIDNHSGFHSLSERHQSVKTLFIQNGKRSEDIFKKLASRKSKGNSLKVDYMMTFGSCEGDEYAKYIQGCVMPMGSVLNNSTTEVYKQEPETIAFVSQWHQHGYNLDDTFYSNEELEQTERPIIQFLVRYSEAKNKRLLIIPRNLRNSELRMMEEAYFRDLIDGEPEFIEPPGYRAVDTADVVVSVQSTLGYESIARGNKTAIFSARGPFFGAKGMNFGWPGGFQDEGLFWTNKLDPNSFVRILDYLFEVDDLQWQKDLESINFSALMIYDPGNATLRSTFEKILGPPPVSRH